MKVDKMEVMELDFTKDFEEVNFDNTEIVADWGGRFYNCEECK